MFFTAHLQVYQADHMTPRAMAMVFYQAREFSSGGGIYVCGGFNGTSSTPKAEFLDLQVWIAALVSWHRLVVLCCTRWSSWVIWVEQWSMIALPGSNM